MMKRVTKTKHKSRQAFTLVELIVVLVILAVLAAMLVPALTGYIKKAKKEKLVTNAKYALVASQAVMTELYGLGPGAMTNVIGDSNSGGGKGGDVRWDDQYNTNPNSEKVKWGNKVLQLMDRDRDHEPYLLIFGVGHSQVESLSTTEKYTVYYLAYVEDENSPAVFYVNGDWIYTYPRDDTSIMKEVKFKMLDGSKTGVRNTIVKDGAEIPLQLYVVSTYQKNYFWTEGDSSLRGHSEPHFKG